MWTRISRRATAIVGAAVILSLSWGSASFAEQKKLKVAAMLGSPVEQQWVGRLHDALVMAQERGDIDYVVSENVEDADMIRVLREYAEGGYDLIVGEVYPVEREARRVTQDYPNVAFLLGSSLHPQAPNFAVFDNWNQDAAYLAGLIAGGMTKSNVIGAVGGYPIPEVNRLVGAYKQGACEANPNVKVLVTYVGSWYDPPRSKESGIAQIDSDADFIYAERFGAIPRRPGTRHPRRFQPHSLRAGVPGHGRDVDALARGAIHRRGNRTCAQQFVRSGGLRQDLWAHEGRRSQPRRIRTVGSQDPVRHSRARAQAREGNPGGRVPGRDSVGHHQVRRLLTHSSESPLRTYAARSEALRPSRAAY